MPAQRLILPRVVPASPQWVGARVWRLDPREQPPHVVKQGVLECVTGAFAPRLEELREQGRHRRPFVYEEADVALGLGEYKGSFERSKCLTRFVSCLQGQRAQGQDLDDASHPPSGLRRPKQPIEQTKGIVEVRTHRIVLPLGDEYTHQCQILLLARIGGFVVDGELAGFGPTDSRRKVVLHEGKPRPRCLTACDQQPKEGALASQVSELLQCCDGIGMQTASLLHTSE